MAKYASTLREIRTRLGLSQTECATKGFTALSLAQKEALIRHIERVQGTPADG